jgi:hypothetical protein
MFRSYTSAAAGNKHETKPSTTIADSIANVIANTKADAASQAQLDDFLRRTNSAGLHGPNYKEYNPKENNCKDDSKEEEDWELIDEAEGQEQDEWTLIGKTASEKAELEKRIAELDGRVGERVKRVRKR